MTPQEERVPASSRILARILDYRRPLDYLWLAAFAAFPLGLSAGIGIDSNTADGFAGYWDRFNWTSLVLILPLAAFALRWMLKHIGPVSTPDLPPSPPPVVGLVDSRAGRETAYAVLRRALLSPRNLYVALLITSAIHIADMSALAAVYLSGASQVCSTQSSGVDCAREVGGNSNRPPRLEVPFAGAVFKVEKDWSVAYLGSGNRVGKWPNLVLNVVAYAVQFAVVLLGALAGILIVRHNWFFLARVYQRRGVTPGDESSYIHVNLDDDDKCFGFRPANAAFNVQVLALAVAAVFILATRFANVGPGEGGSAGTGLFPDAGQWLAVVGWLLALLSVSLPILVKLLPRCPSRGDQKAPASLVGYLREFLSDRAWAFDKDTPPEEINAVAARFAEHAFWPTGNNRARQLYFVSFWVFFIALVPDPRAIATLHHLPAWTQLVAWLVAAGLAWGTTWLLFRMLRTMLTFIDERLVSPPSARSDDGARSRRRKIPIGIFISYRRGETAAYTGRLYDSLATHLDKDKVFMDLDKIPGGVDFLESMKMAIDSAQAMIVVIGPEWLTISRGDGIPRIQDPHDFVHQEVALGLQRGIPIIPVLVGGAVMPTEKQLPDGLKALALRNAREIADSRWVYDVDRLVNDLATAVSVRPGASA
jgi:hypothetical protein